MLASEYIKEEKGRVNLGDRNT